LFPTRILLATDGSAEAVLAEEAAAELAAGTGSELHVVYVVEKEVIHLGEGLDAGLIMTGGKKRPRVERLFGAGFSERVLRKADRPVLVVGERGRRSSTVPK